MKVTYDKIKIKYVFGQMDSQLAIAYGKGFGFLQKLLFEC